MKKIKYFLKAFLYRIRGEHTTEKLIKLGLKVGKNFQRMHGVILDPAHCWLINIGDNVRIGPRAHILAHDGTTLTDLGYAKIGRVNIGNNVFIGTESLIMPNVTIGDNSIIAGGSVVTKNVPSNSVYGGNPAKLICSYDEYIEKMKNELTTRPVYDESYTLRNKNITDAQKQEMIESLADGIGFVK